MTSGLKTKKTLKVKPMLTTAVLGFVVLCSISSANAGRMNEYATDISTSNVEAVRSPSGTSPLGNSPQGKKDLAELGQRLQTRFSEVFGEIVGLILGQITPSQTGNVQTHPSADVPVNFQDTDGNPYQQSINTLAQKGIVDASSTKFYPDNYLRTYELVIMLVKAKLSSSNQVRDAFQNFKTNIADVSHASYLPFVAYADSKGYLDSLISTQNNTRYLHPNHQITQKELGSVLFQFSNIPEISNLTSNNKITRAQYADLLIQVFYADSNQPVNSLTREPINSPTFLQTLLTMVSK